MNNNIDLTKILKDCPKGWKFYTPVWGEVTFIEIKKNKDCLFPICIYTNTSSSCTNLTKDGRYLINRTGTECILFPSKEQRDWSKFTAPWYKKERDTIAWLEESGKKEYRLKSFKNEDVRKFMQYIEKQAKAYEFNLPNRGYDIYAFAKDLLVWLEKQGEQEEPQVYETEDGKIITYSETDGYKFVEPKFHEGDWVVNKFGDSWHIDSLDKKNYQVSDVKGNWNYFPISKQDEIHLWTIQDARDGDVLAAHECYGIFKEIDGLNIKCYCAYHYLGFNPCFYRDTVQNKNAFFPATKEQQDALMKAINDAGCEWNAKTKILEKIAKPKFDPKILKPFDKVLVRDDSISTWKPDHFGYKANKTFCRCVGSYFMQCIPYNEKTKHLIGTTDEAPEYYRYWED